MLNPGREVVDSRFLTSFEMTKTVALDTIVR